MSVNEEKTQHFRAGTEVMKKNCEGRIYRDAVPGSRVLVALPDAELSTYSP